MSKPLSSWASLLAGTSHVALIVAIVLQSGFHKAALLALPLLLPLPGILGGRSYTYSWASMLVVFYAAGYLASGYAQPQTKWQSFGLGTLAALDFVGLVLYVRLLQRERPAAAVKNDR